MKALTKPEKFRSMSRIYGYELPDDIIGYQCEFQGYTDIVVDGVVVGQTEDWDCVSVVDEIFDCDGC